ncbi:hypothetical protein KOW79_008865 [Hemibagrus wyckioides]|uniref:GRAM domain-containing protein n=1 Tax=Hemibagrus wyckioides TaxID=337641 RepID=A0A9D3SPT9_9TELE|nr:hypothetical protein KOW79_008865 [Hemibagrus wyckioides]
MSDQAEDVGLLTPQDASEPPKEEYSHNAPQFRVHLLEELSCEDTKKCTRGSSSRPLREKSRLQGSCVHELISLPPASSSSSSQSVSKYNSQYHKLFHNVPKEENLMKGECVCVCVCIPIGSVRLVKKHKTAGLVPNGLAITTDSSQKYVFVSLLSRDSVYDVLRQICTHLQVNGKKSLSFKQYMEQPTSLSLDEFPVPNEYPVAVGEFTPVLKWRRKPSVASVSASLPDLLGNSTSSLSAVDTSFQPSEPLQALESEKILLTEPVPELGQMEYQLLKFFILLIILLILSSCYLAFRVCSLEQQLSFLSSKAALPLQDR